MLATETARGCDAVRTHHVGDSLERIGRRDFSEDCDIGTQGADNIADALLPPNSSIEDVVGHDPEGWHRGSFGWRL
jgi:hypothetical protein